MNLSRLLMLLAKNLGPRQSWQVESRTTHVISNPLIAVKIYQNKGIFTEVRAICRITNHTIAVYHSLQESPMTESDLIHKYLDLLETLLEDSRAC